jgi:hypothetical protein
MEATTTQNATPEELLKTWWDGADFKDKNFFSLRENGELVLNAMGEYPERVIATLTPENADAVIKALSDKFPEVENKNKDLQQEWDAAEDKLKLMSKVSRLKDYLKHTNAIGDFSALMKQVDGWDATLNQLSEENYKARLTLTEQAEKLANEGEQWKDTTQALKDIGEQWKAVGYVDKHRSDELWNRIEKARDHFFERKRTYQQEQEKDMLRNLDIKMELVEKAENLAASEEWRGATDSFRQLMEQWKATGRTVADKNESLWKRFIEAQNVFYGRKRVHFEEISKEQEINYAAKLALVERAESLRESQEWNKTAQAYAGITEEWKKTGRVPAEKADELWARLKTAQEFFFTNRRQHLETVKVGLEDNYAQKLALVNRAESLKNSSQWRETTDELQELMAEWKKVGPVPRQHTQTLWEQFLAARKYFFDRKDSARDRRKQQVEKQQQYKLQHTQDFHRRVEHELREEEERLADLREALQNVTAGPKEEELRTHLNNLIRECEVKIKHKTDKAAEARKQADSITSKTVKQEENPAPEESDIASEARTEEAMPEESAPEEAETSAPEESAPETVAHMPEADEAPGAPKQAGEPEANEDAPAAPGESNTEETA